MHQIITPPALPEPRERGPWLGNYIHYSLALSCLGFRLHNCVAYFISKSGSVRSHIHDTRQIGKTLNLIRDTGHFSPEAK
jgi:hypothetical protein